MQTPKTGRRGAVQFSAVRARAICAPTRLWGACFLLVVWRGETSGRGAILLRSGEVKRASAFAHTCLHVLRYGRPHSRSHEPGAPLLSQISLLSQIWSPPPGKQELCRMLVHMARGGGVEGPGSGSARGCHGGRARKAFASKACRMRSPLT